MGTVIIYRGEAFVFEGKSFTEAVQDFCVEWFPDSETGFSVYPMRGKYRKDGRMDSDTTLDGRWGSSSTEQA